MRCDEFLCSIRTGNPWRRTLARLHAARCRRCAQLLQRVAAMKHELSQSPPLSQSQRRLWEQAMEVEREAPARSAVRRPLLAAVAATLLVAIAVAIWQWVEGTRSVDGPVAETHQFPAIQLPAQVEEPHQQRPVQIASTLPPPANASRELAEMGAGLDRLSAKLDELSRKARLLTARRQAAELLGRYASTDR
jgi:hypothetical protein